MLKLKTENTVANIIFKCVNSAVRPIFNEKVVEKWSLWDPWIVHGCTVHCWKVKTCGWGGKKKKERNANADSNEYVEGELKDLNVGCGISIFLEWN